MGSKGNLNNMTENEIRGHVLRFFYDRNFNAKSAMGKKESAMTIPVIKAELKEKQALSLSAFITHHSKFAAGAQEGLGYGK